MKHFFFWLNVVVNKKLGGEICIQLIDSQLVFNVIVKMCFFCYFYFREQIKNEYFITVGVCLLGSLIFS